MYYVRVILVYIDYMTDHAGPRRFECHPGTKFLHPPVGKQVLAPEEQFWRLLINIIFFGLTKNGCQNRSSGAKTALLRWAGAKS